MLTIDFSMTRRRVGLLSAAVFVSASVVLMGSQPGQQLAGWSS
jgi:hypothetical protein